MDPSSTVSFYVISASTSAVSVAAEEEKQDDPHTAVVGSASASVTAAAAKKDNDPKAGIVASAPVTHTGFASASAVRSTQIAHR